MNNIGYVSVNQSGSANLLISLSKKLSFFVIGIGCLVLIGWALDINALKSILPGLASMKSNTALLFILSGISLWMQVKGRARSLALACAFLIVLLGLMTFGEYTFNRDFGIDQILFRDTNVGSLYPGRMSLATALSFFLIGLTLIFLDRLPQTRLHESLLIAVFAISGMALIGYLYGVSSLYQIGLYTSMALHTALSFILLSMGIFFARPERGLMQIILADTLGGNILRRFLPTAIIMPILLGWIRLWGQRAGLYDTAFGLAIMVISLITTLTIFIWLNARQLTNIDAQRKLVDDNLRESELRFRSTLESMVEGCQIIGYDWRYLYLNASAVKHSQLTRDELIGHTMMECYPGIEESPLFTTLQRCMDERSSHHIVNEFIYPDGALGWFELSIEPAPDGIFILSSDVTEHKQAEMEILKLNTELEERVIKRTAELAALNEQLHQLALFDKLTGLYNRRGFLLLAEEQLLLARSAKRNLLVFYADLDGLKQINDQVGHIAGDEAILSVVRALNKAFRTSDIKARLGGDEFIVLAFEAEECNAEELLARIRKQLMTNKLSISIGVITVDPLSEESIESIIGRADQSMYIEKNSKKNYRNS